MNKTCAPTRSEQLSIRSTGGSNDSTSEFVDKQVTLQQQPAMVTRVTHPHSLPVTAEASTHDTTGEMDGKYDYAKRP